MKKMLRWEIPEDYKDHSFPVEHEPKVCASVEGGVVEFWAEHVWFEGHEMTFRVFGTGNPVPVGYHYVTTAPRDAHGAARHIYRRV